MLDIRNLLGRIKQSLDKDSVNKEIVIISIKEKTRIELKPEEISFSARNIQIKTSPVKRNEIAFNEQAILNEVRIKTGLSLERIVY